MKKYAVIDIGSNSVRLMLVANGNILYKQVETTRLGEGLASSTLLKDEAIARSAKAVETYYQRAINEGAEQVLAFATAAVRTAENGNVFVEEVKRLCGLDVEIISGETEAEIGIVGALSQRDGAVIDIGGASTEIVVREQGALTYKKSVNIGVVRLKDACGLDREKLEGSAQAAAKQFEGVPKQKTYAIGGTATALGAWYLGQKTYDGAKVTGTEIPLQSMWEMADKLLTMRADEICAASCMPKGRADVIAGGAGLLATLMQTLGLPSVTISDRDNLVWYATIKGLRI